MVIYSQAISINFYHKIIIGCLSLLIVSLQQQRIDVIVIDHPITSRSHASDYWFFVRHLPFLTKKKFEKKRLVFALH